jgi:acetyl-CoA acetyltransferase
MPTRIRDQVAIVGVGASAFGRSLPESQLGLAAQAFRAALEDAGLTREAVDGLSINIGWPLGVDYDRVAETFGLSLRYVNQSWTHGRFITHSLQHAAMAVHHGLADCVACLCSVGFTRERGILGGPQDIEGRREEGGSHGESPVYGLTSPAGGAALSMQRYRALYGTTPEQLATVALTLRRHALLNPQAIMRAPLSLEDYLNARRIIDPLRLYDCSLINEGACCVLVTSAERARDQAKAPVYYLAMQGMRSGREEFIFAPPGLGINQQTTGRVTPREADLEVYREGGITQKDVDGLYTYDAFSPLVLFVLERFGFCGPGEAARWIQDGRIGLGGELPVNTSGGLLSEAHVGGWNSIVEMVRQLRGECGARQVAGAQIMQWATVWGDSILFHR